MIKATGDGLHQISHLFCGCLDEGFQKVDDGSLLNENILMQDVWLCESSEA